MTNLKTACALVACLITSASAFGASAPQSKVARKRASKVLLVPSSDGASTEIITTADKLVQLRQDRLPSAELGPRGEPGNLWVVDQIVKDPTTLRNETVRSDLANFIQYGDTSLTLSEVKALGTAFDLAPSPEGVHHLPLLDNYQTAPIADYQGNVIFGVGDRVSFNGPKGKTSGIIISARADNPANPIVGVLFAVDGRLTLRTVNYVKDPFKFNDVMRSAQPE